MKTPSHKRPKKKSLMTSRADVDPAGLARRVRYVGSQAHKDTPSFAGSPTSRPDASICEEELSQDQERVNRWLRIAIERGAIGGSMEGDFPRYAWYKEGDAVYEARLVNQGLGEYKGHRLAKKEWPKGLDMFYD